MPRIEEDIKLDFKDVLLRPKRSTLKSRSQVDLVRTIEFKNSGRTFEGVPLIAANMDTTGTFEMAIEFAKHKCMVAVHKYYKVDEWKKFTTDNKECIPFVAVSTGKLYISELKILIMNNSFFNI